MRSLTPQTLALHVAGSLFWLIAALHLLRVVLEVDVRVGGWLVPAWGSGVAAIAFGALGSWTLKLAHPDQGPGGCC